MDSAYHFLQELRLIGSPKQLKISSQREKNAYLFCLESSIKILGLSRITRNNPKRPGVRKNTDMCDTVH